MCALEFHATFVCWRGRDVSQAFIRKPATVSYFAATASDLANFSFCVFPTIRETKKAILVDRFGADRFFTYLFHNVAPISDGKVRLAVDDTETEPINGSDVGVRHAWCEAPVAPSLTRINSTFAAIHEPI
jgi:hypothetical protein